MRRALQIQFELKSTKRILEDMLKILLMQDLDKWEINKV